MKFILTFVATTRGGKFCLEITHKALVHVFLSVDFTKEQSADSISSANVSGVKRSPHSVVLNV